MHRIALAAVLGLALLAQPRPALSQAGVQTRPFVKVSLAKDNPNVHTLKRSKGDLVEFYLFVEGPAIRGVDLGVDVQGGEFVGYIPNWEMAAWTPLQVPNPYPGSIGQATGECLSSPCMFGRILVRATNPNEKITVDVIPSKMTRHAFVMNCDLSTTNGLHVFPAGFNTDAPAPHDVDGEEYVSKGWPEEADRATHDHTHDAPADTTMK
jgi:hypothetical protein